MINEKTSKLFNNKMNRQLRNKTTSILALFLIFAIALPSICSLNTFPTTAAATASPNWNAATASAVAAGMKWDFPSAENYNASDNRLLLWNRYQDKIPTYVYGVVSPNPVGVGQEVSIVLFNPVTPPAGTDENGIRYYFNVIVTDPDGVNTTLPSSGTIKSDSTGTAYTKFTPTKIGNYTVTVKFNSLFYEWYDTSSYRDYWGVTLMESTHSYRLTVQQDAVIPTAITGYPLPTEYWSRPIEGQNQAWAQIASNWLNSAHDRNYGSTNNRFQTQGIAPNSGHILWTKPIEDGGVVGDADYFGNSGETFMEGSPPYTPRFQTQIIMNGRLYYELPDLTNPSGGGWMCVDLQTGETIWGPKTFPASPSFGYYYDLDTINQHGILNPGWIFAVSGNNWYSIHPIYGTYGQTNVTNVPSGFEAMGPKGEILRYVIYNYGTTANPNYYLLQWNSSKVIPGVSGRTMYSTGTFNANVSTAYDWNISLPIANTLTGAINIKSAIYNDVILCSNGTLYSPGSYSSYTTADTGTLFAVSLKPESRGQTLFGPTNYATASKDGSWTGYMRAGEGVFVMLNLPEYSWTAYSMYTGQKLWDSAPETDVNSMGYYSYMYSDRFLTGIGDGKFISTGYAGYAFCYDLKNGSLLWNYSAPTHAEIFQYYTLPKYAMADGKLYLGAYEHSPDNPLYKGNRVRCLNMTTGEEIWSELGYAGQTSMAIADGTLIYWNQYDGQVYSVGKGASSITVTAPDAAVALGSSVTIKGTVTDIAAGTKQKEQAARFPNGVPCVSDASQSQWMEYVYMQKPKPTNATGVDVNLYAVDANGNYRQIGTATTTDGFFSFNWKPDVEGKYTVYASFAGSESYWPSNAVTAFSVDPAAATPAPTATPVQSPADLYFIPAIAALFIAIIVVGVLTIFIGRKRP